jgi:hypothetical protein
MTTNMMNRVKQLHESFMQFKVEIRGKSFVKKSNEMIDNSAKAFNASTSSITGSIKLAASRQLKDVKNSEQSIRAFIRMNTVRLGDYEIISPARFIKIKERFNELVSKHNEVIETLITDWNKIKEEDKKNLGSLYNEAHYPNVEEVRASHSLHWIVSPLPDVSSFRIKGLDIEDSTELAEKLNGVLENQLSVAYNDLLNKILYGKNPDANKVVIDGEEVTLGNGLQYAIHRISSFDEENSFKQNTIDNVNQICEIVEDLNAFGDPQITKICDSLKKICKKDANDLRDSEREREEFINEAQKALEDIESVMEGLV